MKPISRKIETQLKTLQLTLQTLSGPLDLNKFHSNKISLQRNKETTCKYLNLQ